MKLKHYLLVICVGPASYAHAESYYASQFQNNFFLGCSKEMSSGVDALPADLAMSVCSCVAASIVTTYNTEQLKSIDRDIGSYHQLLAPYTDECMSVEVPKYMETHPEFLEQYIRQHPEIL